MESVTCKGLLKIVTVIRYVTSKKNVIILQILLKNEMITLRITYKFIKDVCGKKIFDTFLFSP
jgi:hypothetical protein